MWCRFQRVERVHERAAFGDDDLGRFSMWAPEQIQLDLKISGFISVPIQMIGSEAGQGDEGRTGNVTWT